jgi:murein DD-endopeptidase MepM/ murein hydrolase activator NlpD
MNKTYLAGLFLVIGLAAALGWLLFTGLDLSGPTVDMNPRPTALGAHFAMNLRVADQGAGLKSVEVDVLQNGRQAVPLKVEYPVQGMLKGSGVHSQDLRVLIEPRRLGLTQGPAELRVTAVDASRWRLFSGNETLVRLPVQVDWRPPRVQMLTGVTNINMGGTGLVIYKLDKEAVSGVQVSGQFFPGYPCSLGKGIYACYFACPAYIEGAPPNMTVVARDASGNEAKAGFLYHIRAKRFRDDKVELDDQFLTAKVGELLPTAAPNQPLVTSFLEINRKLRNANHQHIAQVCARSQPNQLWSGPFVRPATAPEAAYADRRVYSYQGQEIDRQVHLGVDLASLAAAPVQAAGSGVVVLAEELGIYGNCVVIDHGQGVFSLYGHMSQLSVAAGQQVATGQVIGNTGSTGLAGGDHLHFSMLVSGVFVNPIEWWDSHWIKDNVEIKYKQAKEMLAPPPPPPAPGARPALDTTGVIR